MTSGPLAWVFGRCRARHRLVRRAAAVAASLGLLAGLCVPALAAGHRVATPALQQAGDSGPYAHAPLRYSLVARPLGKDQKGHGPSAQSVVYTPALIQGAYDIPATGGAGERIAIVDAYGDPTLAADLTAFDTQFGLGSVTYQVYYPDGAPSSANSSWAIETALDVEWAHASAQAATIDVIVEPDSSFTHLLDGINYAITNLRAAAISMSWGSPETTFAHYGYLPSYEAAFQTAVGRGITLLASAGDQGATDGTRALAVDYPASSPEVVGVGGTTLTLSSAGAYVGEAAWSDSGGGYSVEFPEPDFQTTAAIHDPAHMRGVPDVAFDANPATGVYVYAGGQWYAVGGTSVGAPNWAAIVADNNAAHNGAPTLVPQPDNNGSYSSVMYDAIYNSALYGLDFHDVTSGNNGYYTAGPGWDPVTGLGTPIAGSLFSNQ